MLIGYTYQISDNVFLERGTIKSAIKYKQLHFTNLTHLL